MVYPSDYAKLDMPAVGYPKVVQKAVNGKIVNEVEFVVDGCVEQENFEYNDFALSNLLSSGVDLKELRFKEISLRAIDEICEMYNNPKTV